MSKIIEWIKANPWKFAVIALAAALIIAAPVSYCGGYFYGKGSCPRQAAVIDDTPTVTDRVTPPKQSDICAWYGNCYKSDITITGKFRADKKEWFDVEARDSCKHAAKSFKFGFPVRERSLSIQIVPYVLGGYNSAIKNADLFLGGQIQIIKNRGLVSIGGAGLYQYSPITKDMYGGAGLVLGFNP